ncbi:MAG: pirin [Desulfovibrionaceae bacterium]|nr:pirin [Desulfovibrionaceae bacterium]MBF0515320.1 pirin [Desulfovibrionaceae bacterium]
MPTKKIALKAYVDEAEHDQVAVNAKRAGLSISTFVKRVCLGQPVPNLEKQRGRLELLKINGDLGRLGGLFKLCLTNKEAKTTELHSEVRRILREIEARQRELRSAVARI